MLFSDVAKLKTYLALNIPVCGKHLSPRLLELSEPPSKPSEPTVNLVEACVLLVDAEQHFIGLQLLVALEANYFVDGLHAQSLSALASFLQSLELRKVILEVIYYILPQNRSELHFFFDQLLYFGQVFTGLECQDQRLYRFDQTCSCFVFL